MGNYVARRQGFLDGWKVDAAHYMFQGKKDSEIAELIWQGEFQKVRDDPVALKKKLRACCRRLQFLRKDPKFQEYYKTIVTEWKVHAHGPALTRLMKQIDSTDGWLANKAANDVLNRIGMDPFTDNAADNTVTFKFEGMPELGGPQTDEGDAD